MKRYPVILTIAGSDCSGGAGIQADIKTISALGCYAASVITAVTVQNTWGVKDVHAIPPEIVRGQIEAVMDDLHPDAIKIGMVSNRTVVSEIVDCLQKYRPSCVIYDPVMVSTSGRRLMDDIVVEQIKNELFPLVHLITPNLDEVATLTGHKPTTLAEMKKAARKLSNKYHIAVLVKGGHLNGDEMYDVLHEHNTTYVYKESKIESSNLHGTGCTLSSSIATYMAKGCRLNEAIDKSKYFISQSIAAAKELNIGSGNGPLWHFHRNNL
ncbi:MAG: bifunctional hydroxymethylpyrimidine kinase/phosphomethylpyrimidine kinase [Bacteroides sp.]|uniref:bifunctional hydroxymethylpyrimidine kinase/phosphomethylpyrimidine kinase n=1 Tax=Bacteroides sp. TaxID=29523 RepID=UPI002FC5E186